MTIGAVNRNKVKQDVQKAFKILADAGGIEVSERDLPDVEVKSEEFFGSNYDPVGHKIVISPDSVNKGHTYFEEASHALRDLVRKRQGISPEQFNKRVSEFYGMAGDVIGRRLAKEKGLEHLDWAEDEDIHSRESWAKRIKLARDFGKVYRDRKALESGQGRQVQDITTAVYRTVDRALNEFNQGKRDYASLRKSVEEAKSTMDNLQDGVRKSPVIAEFAVKAVERYRDTYSDMLEAFKIYGGAPSKENQETVAKFVKDTAEMSSPREMKRYFALESEETTKIRMLAKSDAHSVRTHWKAYDYARQCSSEELLGEGGFYGLEDEVVKERFFHKKKGGLEKSVEAVTAAFFALGAVCLIANANMTGYAISSGVNVAAGQFLGIGFLFSVVLLALLRLRRKLF